MTRVFSSPCLDGIWTAQSWRVVRLGCGSTVIRLVPFSVFRPDPRFERHHGYAAPATLELLSNRLTMARRAIARSGLCNRWWPLSRASRKRSGAVSPLMRNAGTRAP